MTSPQELYESILERLEFDNPTSKQGKMLARLTATILSKFTPEKRDRKALILEIVRESLPSPASFFTDDVFGIPLMPIYNLRRALEFYSINPIPQGFNSIIQLPENIKNSKQISAMIWLCTLFELTSELTNDIVSSFASHLYASDKGSVASSTRTNEIPEAPPRATERAASDNSTNIIDLVTQRLNKQDENISDLKQSILETVQINQHSASQPFSTLSNHNIGAQDGTNKQTPAVRSHYSYSSVGYIPNLPKSRTSDGNSAGSRGAMTLMKLYSHPNKQFAGTGDLKENLATYHQAFMSDCRTLELTQAEALNNLHVLFKPNSEASIFYHRHVLPTAQSIDQAFKMLYNRFMSLERRDRLLQKWNKLSYNEFASKPGATNQSALRDLCETASLLQLQLGQSYQDEQHLRDALMNACKYEPWAHRLATMPTKEILDIQESLARAITAEENLQAIRRKSSVTPALVNFTRDRPGMSYRRYEKDSKPGRHGRSAYYRPHVNAKGPDGKNPIRNHMRLLCRNCDSDTLFLRECDKLTSTQRIRFASTVLLTESICSDSDECNHALDVIQGFGNDAWHELEAQCSSSIESENEEEVNNTHFNSSVDLTSNLLSNDLDTSYSALSNLSYCHFMLRDAEVESLSKHHKILFTDQRAMMKFEGICMDDGAQRSVAGLAAYTRYCSHTNSQLDLIPSKELFRFGDGTHRSLGKTSIRFPIDSLGNFVEYVTDVVDVDVPILFGLDKMKELRWYVNEVSDELCCFDQPELKIKLQFQKGHLYYNWPSALILFTKRELEKIHRRFAHPSASKLYDLIRRAAPSELDAKTRIFLDEIVAHCNSCQRMAPKPFVFQVTMPDNIVFNHEVCMDLCWLESRPQKPVLHVVDRGTHFSAARFVASESAESIWNTFLECWVSIYVGFPNVISHDHGSLFASEFFQGTCAKFGIITKQSPTESHNSLGPGERYHAPLRKI